MLSNGNMDCSVQGHHGHTKSTVSDTNYTWVLAFFLVLVLFGSIMKGAFWEIRHEARTAQHHKLDNSNMLTAERSDVTTGSGRPSGRSASVSVVRMI